MKQMAYTFGVAPIQLRDGRVMRIVKEYLRHMLARTIPKGTPWTVQRMRHSGVYILLFKWTVPEGQEEVDDGVG